jgi:hypothetical protein
MPNQVKVAAFVHETITNMAVSQIMNVLNFFYRSRRAGVAPDETGSSLHAGPEPGPGLDARNQAED